MRSRRRAGSSARAARTWCTPTAPRRASRAGSRYADGSPRCSSRTPGRSRPSADAPRNSRSAGSGSGRAGPSHILCVSESERRTGQEAGIAARWSVIHNGIDLDRFRPGDHTVRAEARATLPLLEGTDRDAPLVVCVGRLTRQKGQDVLLRAWRRMAVPGARLVLVGDGPDRDGLEASAPPGVLFTGGCEDVRPWIHAADVLVLPSRWEGMALAPLEAMACGRAVVLTDVNGARESLPPGDEDHCLVPPEDPAALAAALTALLTDPDLREAVSRRALRHTRAAFDVRRTAGAVAGLYQELVGMSGPTTRKRTER
ncbi:Glycosyl transferases group 1 [Streptomyces sp. Ncost-T6T-2b]|nr:Glycosyl transferases group 1 [Streptomyces sp. Ncost-T6T-2b]